MIAQLWSQRARVIAECFEAIRDLTVFGARETMTARVAQQSAAIAAAHARATMIASGPRYVLECVTAAGLVAVALWMYRVAGPGQWITRLALLGLAAYRLLPPLQLAFAAIARIRSDAPRSSESRTIWTERGAGRRRGLSPPTTSSASGRLVRNGRSG